MIKPNDALSTIPDGLRIPLLQEFNEIINNFMERRWGTSELSGGRFCEVVYTIINGYGTGSYATTPQKPSNFVEACRNLERQANLPRSFQILIPRLLPALYEVRNNRNVGHVGGDVNPDFMDASVVVSIASWVLAELIRVLHNISTDEAQQLVDNIVERRSQLIWSNGDIRRVLNPKTPMKDQILLLIGSSSSKVLVNDLFLWTESKDRRYFNKIIHSLHTERFIEYNSTTGDVTLLPPGSNYVTEFINRLK